MKKVMLIVIVSLLGQLTFAQFENKKVLLCSYQFNNKKELNDWQMEGEGKANIVDGKLVLEPEHFQMLKKLMDQGKISKKNEASEYQTYVKDAMTKKYGADVERYYVADKDGDSGNGEKQFSGGSFNFWNTKFPTKENFSIEFDFKSLYPTPLQMLLFSAVGTNGKSIFDASFPKRYGLANEIMKGDISDYRLSFFEPQRKTANLRRAPGRKLLFEGEDVVSRDPEKIYHCEIKKVAGSISYIVDGKIIFTYVDEKPLGGGHWGFRLMPCAMGQYDDIKVYELF